MKRLPPKSKRTETLFPYKTLFRSLSKDESDIKWTLGAFYLKATPFFGQDFFEISRYLQTRQLTESIAAFGQVTYPIFEGTNITGGLRYTYETQKLVDAYTQFTGQNGRAHV